MAQSKGVSMKKTIAITGFVGIQLLFITLAIYKETLLVKLSYQKQTYQEELKTLITSKEKLTSTLYDLQNPKRVKNLAQEKLGLQPIVLKKIKRLSV